MVYTDKSNHRKSKVHDYGSCMHFQCQPDIDEKTTSSLFNLNIIRNDDIGSFLVSFKEALDVVPIFFIL